MGEGSPLSLECWLRTTDPSVPFVRILQNRWLCCRKSIWHSEVLGKGAWSFASVPASFQRFVFKSLCQSPFVCCSFERCSQRDPSQHCFDTHVCIFTLSRLLLGQDRALSSSQPATPVTSAWLRTNARDTTAVMPLVCGACRAPAARSHTWGPVAACQPFSGGTTSRQFVFGTAHAVQMQSHVGKQRGESLII